MLVKVQINVTPIQVYVTVGFSFLDFIFWHRDLNNPFYLSPQLFAINNKTIIIIVIKQDGLRVVGWVDRREVNSWKKANQINKFKRQIKRNFLVFELN